MSTASMLSPTLLPPLLFSKNRLASLNLSPNWRRRTANPPQLKMLQVTRLMKSKKGPVPANLGTRAMPPTKTKMTVALMEVRRWVAMMKTLLTCMRETRRHFRKHAGYVFFYIFSQPLYQQFVFLGSTKACPLWTRCLYLGSLSYVHKDREGCEEEKGQGT